MKFRTVKKRIHRNIKWIARHQLRTAFKDSRERKEWIKELSDWHIKHWKDK